MNNETKRPLGAGLCLLAAFALWTAAVRTIDVAPIGPLGSSVGFAALNDFFHRLTGVHWALYHITDWLSLVPVAIAGGFALLGLSQWSRRRNLLRVDADILALGGFYLAVIAAYALFEVAVVNRRPVLIDGILEASYPSSTTVLVLCVTPTAAMQLRTRLRGPHMRLWCPRILSAYAILMVTGRLISGVHWLTDIIGGILLSAGLVMIWRALTPPTKGVSHEHRSPHH